MLRNLFSKKFNLNPGTPFPKMEVYTITTDRRKARIYDDGKLRILQDVNANAYLSSNLSLNQLQRLWIGIDAASVRGRASRLCFHNVDECFKPVDTAELVVRSINKDGRVKWCYIDLPIDNANNRLYWHTYKKVVHMVKAIDAIGFNATIKFGEFEFVLLNSHGLNNLRLALRLVASAQMR